MKRRLVKKASRIFREQPDRVKPCHWHICAKSWRMNLRKMSIAERYAMSIALAQGIRSAVKAHLLSQKPRQASGGLAIVGENGGHEHLLDPRGNIIIDGIECDIHLRPIADVGKGNEETQIISFSNKGMMLIPGPKFFPQK